jgi:hypothetical protein
MLPREPTGAATLVLGARLTVKNLSREGRAGNGAAQLIKAHGAVVPTDLERSEVKIEFFNCGIHGRTVRRAQLAWFPLLKETRWICRSSIVSETGSLVEAPKPSESDRS